MLIDLFELVDGSREKLKLSPELEQNEIEYRGDKLEIKDYNFDLNFIAKKNKHIDFECVGKITLLTKCDLCLEPVEISIDINQKRDLDMNKTDKDRIDDLDESAYIIDTKFNFDIFIHDEILVNMPMKILCKDDCKGICNRCGANLNLGSCECDNNKPDSQMSKILDVFNQFKEV